MQTANNTNNYTVEGLVVKYRNFVEDNTPKVREFDGVEFFDAPSSIVDSNPDQQLIVSLYKNVAGKKADKKVLETLAEYEQHFYKDALDSEEFAFLCENFEEVIAYEFSHRQEWGGMHEVSRFWFSYNCNNMKGLIHDKIHIKNGMTVFIPNSGYCDIASLFKGCIVKGYSTKIYDPNDERSKSWQKDSSEIWALGQIRLFAAGIQSEILPCYNQDLIDIDKESVDIIVCDYANFIFWDCIELYQLLKTKGQMYVFAKRDDLIDCSKRKKYLYDDLLVRTKNSSDYIKELSESIKSERAKDTNSLYDLKRKLFLNMIIEDKTIKSLVAFQEDNKILGWSEDCILIEVDKNQHSIVYAESINRGEKAEFDIAELESDMLWPGYYMVKRPQNGKPLSSLVRVFNTKGENVKQYWDRKAKKVALSGDVKVLMPREASANFAEACLSENDFRSVSDPMFEGWESKFICPNQHGVCIYMSSKGMLLWYVNEDPTDKYVCVDIIPYLVPKKGVDHRYIAALLLTPEVKQQIESICDGTITTYTMSLILNKIIVPNHTPKERLQFLANVSFNAMMESQEKLKKNHNDYKKAVRMRKHALTQSLSSIDAMFYALNAYRNRQDGKLSNDDVISRRKMTTVKDAFEFIGPKLKNMMYTLEKIADVEYSFDSASWINPEQFIEDYIAQNESGWLNFKPVISWNKGNNLLKQDLIDPFTKEVVASKGDPKSELFFSKDALKHILNNVVANAISHGFTDSERSNYQLRFSWHEEGTSLVVEIENNGTPIPSDRDTASLLEYGVSGALHKDGHNGIGCNEIDDIMRRYDGKVEIVSTPDDEFTVKYILTFKSNILFSL